jgi:hypothetical protein
MGTVCSTEGHNNNNPNFGKRSVGTRPLGRHKVVSKKATASHRPCGCEMWIPHFLDNRLTNGGEVVCAVRDLLPGNIFWYSFLLKAKSTPRTTVWLKGLGKLKKTMT